MPFVHIGPSDGVKLYQGPLLQLRSVLRLPYLQGHAFKVSPNNKNNKSHLLPQVMTSKKYNIRKHAFITVMTKNSFLKFGNLVLGSKNLEKGMFKKRRWQEKNPGLAGCQVCFFVFHFSFATSMYSWSSCHPILFRKSVFSSTTFVTISSTPQVFEQSLFLFIV